MDQMYLDIYDNLDMYKSHKYFEQIINNNTTKYFLNHGHDENHSIALSILFHIIIITSM